MMHHHLTYLALLISCFIGGTIGFTAPRTIVPTSATTTSFPTFTTALHAEGGDDDAADPSEIIARRLVVTGDVDGGYYRTCVKNEASRFRKIMGTMSPPEDGNRAEIYVEGKRKMIDSFIRWCKRGDVGLSQTSQVESVTEEVPTGLYDDFYVQTGR